MTLKVFAAQQGWGRRSIKCPFHEDHRNSAILNANTIYCFSENKLFTLPQIEKHFGVKLDEDAEDAFSIHNRVIAHANTEKLPEPIFISAELQT